MSHTFCYTKVTVWKQTGYIREGEVKFFKYLITIIIVTTVSSVAANSADHINLKYFATAKLYLVPLMAVADREPIVSVDENDSYIETADGTRWGTLNPCADWLNVQADGTFNLDVRCTARADDGSIVRID